MTMESEELLMRVSAVLGNAAIEWPHQGGAESIRKLREEFDAWRVSIRNQCDGCARGLPVENGVHRGPGGFWSGDIQRCTADLYRAGSSAGPANA